MGEITGRALHYVFKVGDRAATAKFYRNILGMKVLRHEEFMEGCEATCNGQYQNRWSKTMIGYGPEDNHFVCEITYNYPIKKYEVGNDFMGITIRSSEVLSRAQKAKWPILPGNVIEDPDGHKFFILNEPEPKDQDPVVKVTLASTNLQTSLDYWTKLLQLKVFSQTGNSILLGYHNDQAKLELHKINGTLFCPSGFGRIAFAVPFVQQPLIDEKVRRAKQKILTPLIELETPGKATVQVIILADPDGHQICFVDEERFRQLSKMDPKADSLLDKFIKKDNH